MPSVAICVIEKPERSSGGAESVDGGLVVDTEGGCVEQLAAYVESPVGDTGVKIFPAFSRSFFCVFNDACFAKEQAS